MRNVLEKLKAIDPFNGDIKGEISAVIMLVLDIIIGDILTGAIGPSSIGNIVNATQSGGALGGASVPSSVTSTWNTIPVMYSIALFLVPIVLIARYLK